MTTDSTTYKSVQFNGKRMPEHQRVWCLILNIPEIPKGFIVHHLNENKRDNDIHNLALISITAHNRIHSHEPWNKGATTKNNKKWSETVEKIQAKRRETFDKRNGERNAKIIGLIKDGKSIVEVSKILKLNRNTIYATINKFNK